MPVGQEVQLELDLLNLSLHVFVGEASDAKPGIDHLGYLHLGHSQISTTMNRYTHVAPEWQREAAGMVAKGLWA